MFFDLSLPEIAVLLVLAVVLFGPDRLPRLVADAARFLHQVRAFTENARADLRRELGPEFDGLNLQDLSPRSFVRNNLLIETEELRGLRDGVNLALPHPLAPTASMPDTRQAPPFDPAGAITDRTNQYEIT